MKSVLDVFYPVIFILLTTTISISGNGEGLSFSDSPQNNGLSAVGAASAADNSSAETFEKTGSNYNGSAAVTGNPSFPVPEPATMFLVGTGLILLAGICRKKLMNKRN